MPNPGLLVLNEAACYVGGLDVAMCMIIKFTVLASFLAREKGKATVVLSTLSCVFKCVLCFSKFGALY